MRWISGDNRTTEKEEWTENENLGGTSTSGSTALGPHCGSRISMRRFSMLRERGSPVGWHVSTFEPADEAIYVCVERHSAMSLRNPARRTAGLRGMNPISVRGHPFLKVPHPAVSTG